MAGNVLIKNANGNTVTLQNPDTNVADVVVDTSAITELTDFIGSNQSLSTSGYQKLPGGLIVQWGSKIVTVANTQQQFTFPITFPNAIYQLVFGTNNSGTVFTGCQGYVVNNSTGSVMSVTASVTASYIAIGY